MKKIRQLVGKILRNLILKLFPDIGKLSNVINLPIVKNYYEYQRYFCRENIENCQMDSSVKIYGPCNINNTVIGKYTYIATNSNISFTEIGNFCSIGPFLLCGWGIHPYNGISTNPMFYSIRKQNGITLSGINKIEERKPIKIGNDVFIGANVTILDGVTIGDGAVIGAGAVVSKDIPPYAIAVGCPIKIIKYRFDDKQIDDLLKIKWWDNKNIDLQDVEKYFFNIDMFIKKYIK